MTDSNRKPWQPVEVAESIFQLHLPIPDNPLEYLNSYLFKCNDGCTLVDCGWPNKGTLSELERQLAILGLKLRDLSQMLVTHFHADHLGLALTIKQAGGGEVLMLDKEAEFASLDRSQLQPRIKHWLVSNGVSEAIVSQLMKDPFSGGIDFPWRTAPDRTLTSSDKLTLGGRSFEVIWTPGHSPGHMCLYNAETKLLFSGDHVLPVITPQVSLYPLAPPHPLSAFLDSLERVASLPVDTVLPAHEHVFHDLPKRVQEIRKHHQERISDLLEHLGNAEKTAYDLALVMKWVGITSVCLGSELPLTQQPGAIGETLAHLDLLEVEGRLRRTVRNGVNYYRLA